MFCGVSGQEATCTSSCQIFLVCGFLKATIAYDIWQL
uniref:Uncharacterized protein n=1 Tax=Rhizophora mucronata TaxID=61149 RepID=A0A2P2Q3V1_RHIMU